MRSKKRPVDRSPGFHQNVPPYQRRSYRTLMCAAGLVAFRVVVKETDLNIQADQSLETLARESILQQRGYIEAYIDRHPLFLETLRPWPLKGLEAPIIQDMIQAADQANVGPMAAVAGAMAQRVGQALLSQSEQIVVENGGDVYLKTKRPVTVGIWAGSSPLSMRFGLRVATRRAPLAVCTSSGTVGHSLSLGQADAVCVLSPSTALADAAATAIGNQIQTAADIHPAVDFGRQIQGVEGLIIIKDDKMGAWGDLEVVALSGKKG